MELAQFIALMALIIGGFALFAVLFVRLEGRVDRLAEAVTALPKEFQQLRRDLAEDLAAQRADAARNLNAVASAITAARRSD